MEIVRRRASATRFVLHNVVERDVRDRGIARIHVSMSHDAGIATAFVVPSGTPDGRDGTGTGAETEGALREAVVDLDALTATSRACASSSAPSTSWPSSRPNAYGHGAVECARAALAGGADWLGVADIDEALAAARRGDRRAGAGLAARPGRRLRGRRSPPASTSGSRRSAQLEAVAAARRALVAAGRCTARRSCS